MDSWKYRKMKKKNMQTSVTSKQKLQDCIESYKDLVTMGWVYHFMRPTEWKHGMMRPSFQRVKTCLKSPQKETAGIGVFKLDIILLLNISQCDKIK